jgi:hypothetical protein
MSEQSGGVVVEPKDCCSSELVTGDDHYLFQSSCCLSYPVVVSKEFGVGYSWDTVGLWTTFDNSFYSNPISTHFYFPLRPMFNLLINWHLGQE